MATPVFYGFNLLRQAGVTVTVTGEATGRPKARLYDGDAGLPWEDTAATGTREVKADQGTLGLSVTAWGAVAGHNLAGATVVYATSPDNSNWTSRDSFVPASSAAFARALGASYTQRYQRVTITGAGAAPQLHELLFTRAFTPGGYLSEDGQHDYLPVTRELTAADGRAWARAVRAPLWGASYLFRELTVAHKTALEAFLATDLDNGAWPFLLTDADGVLRWARLASPAFTFAFIPILKHDLRLIVREAL